VDLPQITRELEEMKDKGMSGTEIRDVLCMNLESAVGTADSKCSLL